MFAGVAAAFTLHVAVAVTTGRLLAVLPHQVVQGLAAALFTLGAVLLVVGRHGKPDQAPTAGREQTGFLRVAGMAFAAVLVAEFGDLTQLVTANLTVKYDDSLAVGLGVLTGAGHGVLIRGYYGRWWALLSGATLFTACVGALVTEFAGVAGVGQLTGLPPALTVPLVAFLLGLLCINGGYRRVEVVGITLGLLELAFIPAAVLAGPQLGAIAAGLAHPLVGRSDYLQLLAANVGAVIMPWMVFYQQGAVIDKRVRPTDLPAARLDTAVGSVVTQAIMEDYSEVPCQHLSDPRLRRSRDR